MSTMIAATMRMPLTRNGKTLGPTVLPAPGARIDHEVVWRDDHHVTARYAVARREARYSRRYKAAAARHTPSVGPSPYCTSS